MIDKRIYGLDYIRELQAMLATGTPLGVIFSRC